MFSNLSWYEVAVLLLLALFVFGDKLPNAITDGLRMLRNLRRMAQNATSDLSRELGTDIRIEDLHPRTFVRKHVLSEADQEALVKPIKGVSDDLKSQTRGLRDDLQEVGQNADRVTGRRKGATGRRGLARSGRPAPESTAASGGPAISAASAGSPGSAGSGDPVVPGGPEAAATPPRPVYDDIT